MELSIKQSKNMKGFFFKVRKVFMENKINLMKFFHVNNYRLVLFASFFFFLCVCGRFS